MTHSLYINAEAVEVSVEKILASQTFARSEKLRSFLRYVVQKEQSGAAQALKGYSIGVDVFGRPEEFDPSSDPLVRVQAGKLRKLLERYYDTEGLDDPIRISIPTGGYVPQYKMNRQECPPPAVLRQLIIDPQPIEVFAQKPLRMRLFAYAGLTALNLALAAFNLNALATTPPAPPAPLLSGSPPPSTQIPRVVIDNTGLDSNLAKKLEDTIREAGNREATIDIMSVSDDLASAENMDSRLRFRIAVKPGAIAGSLEMSLVHDATGDIIYQASYDLYDSDATTRLETIALDLASSTLPVSGEIYRFAAQQGISSDLMQCMSLTELYNNTNARLAFINAKACQRKLVPTGRPGNIYSNLRMLRDASRDALKRSNA